MRFILLIIVAITLSSCFLFGPPAHAKGKVLYQGSFGTNEMIKIIYSDEPYTPHVVILLHQNKKLMDRFEIRNAPQKFVIDKLILSEKNIRSVYKMISDSLYNQLKCIEFNFLETYNTESVLRSFIPLSERERKILLTTVEVIQEKKIDFQISENDVYRLLGWVRINY